MVITNLKAYFQNLKTLANAYNSGEYHKQFKIPETRDIMKSDVIPLLLQSLVSTHYISAVAEI